MPNPAKIAKVETLKEDLQNAGSFVLGDFTGIDVAEITGLRQRCREESVKLQVIKNTLAIRAAQEIGMEDILPHLEGPTAIALADDLVAPARVLKEFTKATGKFAVKAGYVEGRLLDPSGVEALADLPDREQLLTMLVTGLQAPITGLARTLSATIQGLAVVLDQVAKKKEEAA